MSNMILRHVSTIEDPFKNPLENGELFEEKPIFEKKQQQPSQWNGFYESAVEQWQSLMKNVNFSIVVLIQMCKNFCSY